MVDIKRIHPPKNILIQALRQTTHVRASCWKVVMDYYDGDIYLKKMINFSFPQPKEVVKKIYKIIKTCIKINLYMAI